MKTILTAFGTAGLLALTACGGGGGGGENAAANNTAGATDDLALPQDNGTGDLGAGGVDTLENQANALDAGNLSDANASADLNSTADLNATANTATGDTTNTQ